MFLLRHHMCARLLSHLWLSVILWTVQLARLLFPWDFSGKNTGVDCLFPPLRDRPSLGIKPASPVPPTLQTGYLPTELLRQQEKSELRGFARLPPVHYPCLMSFCPVSFFMTLCSSSNSIKKCSDCTTLFGLHFLMKASVSCKTYIK